MKSNMRNVKAPGYYVLVRLKDTEKTTEEVSKGGIVLEIKTKHDVELEQQGMCEGYVLDIGKTAFQTKSGDSEPWCKKGDAVLFHKYSGSLLSNMGDEYVYRMIPDLDILAVFPDEGINIE